MDENPIRCYYSICLLRIELRHISLHLDGNLYPCWDCPQERPTITADQTSKSHQNGWNHFLKYFYQIEKLDKILVKPDGTFEKFCKLEFQYFSSEDFFSPAAVIGLYQRADAAKFPCHCSVQSIFASCIQIIQITCKDPFTDRRFCPEAQALKSEVQHWRIQLIFPHFEQLVCSLFLLKRAWFWKMIYVFLQSGCQTLEPPLHLPNCQSPKLKSNLMSA